MRRSHGPSWFEDREDHMRRNAGGLKELRGASADSQEEWVSQFYNPTELNSSSSQNEPETMLQSLQVRGQSRRLSFWSSGTLKAENSGLLGLLAYVIWR